VLYNLCLAVKCSSITAGNYSVFLEGVWCCEGGVGQPSHLSSLRHALWQVETGSWAQTCSTHGGKQGKPTFWLDYPVAGGHLGYLVSKCVVVDLTWQSSGNLPKIEWGKLVAWSGFEHDASRMQVYSFTGISTCHLLARTSRMRGTPLTAVPTRLIARKIVGLKRRNCLGVSLPRESKARHNMLRLNGCLYWSNKIQ
jgi:hypothetical protein